MRSLCSIGRLPPVEVASTLSVTALIQLDAIHTPRSAPASLELQPGFKPAMAEMRLITSELRRVGTGPPPLPGKPGHESRGGGGGTAGGAYEPPPAGSTITTSCPAE